MTQELWALGFGCLFASFFQAYPPGGSFSRTALKHEVGVKTPFANIVTSLFVTVRRAGRREGGGRENLLRGLVLERGASLFFCLSFYFLAHVAH
jgi:hypothetical protein